MTKYKFLKIIIYKLFNKKIIHKLINKKIFNINLFQKMIKQMTK